MKFLSTYKLWIAIGLIWLFHISGIIGISIGYQDWFLTKTPLNLFVCLILFIWLFPINSKKKIAATLLFFFMGMFSEWLGVNYSSLFGEYAYGSNFGPKLDGVPFLIGCLWALLAFITASMVEIFKIPRWVKLVVSALLMVTLDFLMEQSAPSFDFWDFEGHIPIKNYVTWFILGFIMHVIIWKYKMYGNTILSYNLYVAQFLFFGFFHLFPIA
ncbi:MAG: carotenoid biosynthesis protein [Bacteroidota bacterium]